MECVVRVQQPLVGSEFGTDPKNGSLGPSLRTAARETITRSNNGCEGDY